MLQLAGVFTEHTPPVHIQLKAGRQIQIPTRAASGVLAACRRTVSPLPPALPRYRARSA